MTPADLINCIKSMTPAEKTQLGQALSDIGVSVVITKRLGTVHETPNRKAPQGGSGTEPPMATQEKEEWKPKPPPTVLTGPSRRPLIGTHDDCSTKDRISDDE